MALPKMNGEYKIANTIELAAKPPVVRYIWVLVADSTYSGMTYNGLAKALERCDGDYEQFKMVDIIDNRVINIPKKLPPQKVMLAWKRNYFNDGWSLGKKK